MDKRKTKLALIVTGSLLLALLAGFAYYIYRAADYHDNFSPEHSPVESPVDIAGDYTTDIGATTGSIYIAFLGIDKTEERETWLGIYRTDAISIARIDLDAKKVKVLSIPRDTYTYIPVEDRLDKINHAYAYGSLKNQGVEESIKAINNLLGRPAINYFFLMNMEPIPNIVDEIGGVKLDVEIDMKDHGADLSKGLQVLNGRQAYDYIHWRYSPGGDIDRIKRQQKFMRTLLKQQRDSGRVLESLQIVLKYRNDFQTDLSLQQLIGLGRFLTVMPNDNVEFSYIPGEPQMINEISYWVMYPGETQKVLADFFQP